MPLDKHIDILLIDDDLDDRELISELIMKTDSCYRVTCLPTADEAIIHLSALNFAETPGLIVTEYLLPIVNGFDFLRSLKATERFGHIPLVVYTHSFYPRHKTECMLAGASFYLIKSSTLSEVKEDIEKMLAYCLLD